MTSRRVARVNQAILESVSSTILFSLRDPRVQNVTVTGVEASPDLRSAKVHVSIMGDEDEQQLCLHGLRSARGYLQKRVADRIQTRYTPILEFVLDDSVKRSIEASRIIRESLADGIPVPEDADDEFREDGEHTEDTDSVDVPADDAVPSTMDENDDR